MIDDNTNYSDLTYKNTNLVRKFSHIARFNKAITLLEKYKEEKINFLDFGAGDGFFIKQLNQNKFCFSLNAYDPDKKIIPQMKNLFALEKIENVNIFDDFNKIQSKFKIITCFETLEHFNEKNQIKLINQIKSLLNKDGLLLISVPLEIYLSGFFKGLIRTLSFQKKNETSFINLLKVLFNFKILRTSDTDYIKSHVGFDHNELIKLIENEFIIEKTLYTPLPIFKSVLNSQMFIVCKQKLSY
tara:strand:- start:803 stop:1531 length:729 start_codon:yes stop_codon:yes gene_type:complete